MASQGPLSAGSGANDASIGSVAWGNPTRIVASDNSRSNATPLLGSPTNYLVSSSHGFTIPTGAVINGIVVELELDSNSGTVLDNAVRIVKGGTIGSTDKGRSGSFPWPTTDAYVTFGSSSDLWGESWTAADINASTFGTAISARVPSDGGLAQVDHCRITVHYTESSGRRRRVIMTRAA